MEKFQKMKMKIYCVYPNLSHQSCCLAPLACSCAAMVSNELFFIISGDWIFCKYCITPICWVFVSKRSIISIFVLMFESKYVWLWIFDDFVHHRRTWYGYIWISVRLSSGNQILSCHSLWKFDFRPLPSALEISHFYFHVFGKCLLQFCVLFSLYYHQGQLDYLNFLAVYYFHQTAVCFHMVFLVFQVGSMRILGLHLCKNSKWFYEITFASWDATSRRNLW